MYCDYAVFQYMLFVYSFSPPFTSDVVDVNQRSTLEVHVIGHPTPPHTKSYTILHNVNIFITRPVALVGVCVVF